MDKIFAPTNIKVLDTKYWEIIKIWFPVDKFKQFLDDNTKNGWVNVDLKTSKAWDKKYMELDTWEKDDTKIEDGDLPF